MILTKVDFEIQLFHVIPIHAIVLLDAGDSTFNQNLRQLTMFLFIAII